MCGIIAILGRTPVAASIIEALKRLEYRGYDSAGIATLEAGRLTRRRVSGKLKNLELRLAAERIRGEGPSVCDRNRFGSHCPSCERSHARRPWSCRGRGFEPAAPEGCVCAGHNF